MFGTLAKIFKPVVNTVNKIVQNIAKNVGRGWFSEGVQKVNQSVNQAASSSSSSNAGGSFVAGKSGFSAESGGSAYVSKDKDSKKNKDKDKKGEKAFKVAEVPPRQEYRGEAIADVAPSNNTVVIFRSQDDTLTEAEEQQIDYLLSIEDDPLARDVLLKIKNEGIPEDIAFSDYMEQFAQWGWDELSDEHVQKLMEIVMQDRANDQIESLVVFDEDTGFVVLDRIGIESPYSDEQYVGLQIEEIEMMRGRDVVFVHNHPGGVRASDRDLATAWMAEAESVIIVTPEGYEYVYSRGKSGMVYEGKNDLPFEVAPATVEEYNQLRALSLRQARTLAINHPEYAMYQDGEPTTVTIVGEEPFYGLDAENIGRMSPVSGSVQIIGKRSGSEQIILIEDENGARFWVNVNQFENTSIDTSSLQSYDESLNPVDNPPTVYIYFGGRNEGTFDATTEEFARMQAPSWVDSSIISPQTGIANAMYIGPYPGVPNALPTDGSVEVGKQAQAIGALNWLDTQYPNQNINIVVVGYSMGSDAALIFADSFQNDEQRSGQIVGLAMLGGTYNGGTNGWWGLWQDGEPPANSTNLETLESGKPAWANIVNDAIENGTRVVILDDDNITEPNNLDTFELTSDNSTDLYRYLDLTETPHIDTGVFELGAFDGNATNNDDQLRDAILQFIVNGAEIPGVFNSQRR